MLGGYVQKDEEEAAAGEVQDAGKLMLRRGWRHDGGWEEREGKEDGDENQSKPSCHAASSVHVGRGEGGISKVRAKA